MDALSGMEDVAFLIRCFCETRFRFRRGVGLEAKKSISGYLFEYARSFIQIFYRGQCPFHPVS